MMVLTRNRNEYESLLGETFYPFSAEELDGLGLSPETIAFLTQVGLPADLSLFMFEQLPVNRIANSGDLWAEDEQIQEQLRQFVTIGSDAGGNPLVISLLKNDSLYLLNHENNFAPYLVNSSLVQLMECDIAFTEAINRIQSASESDHAAIQQELSERIQTIDPKAMEDQRFWVGIVNDVIELAQ